MMRKSLLFVGALGALVGLLAGQAAADMSADRARPKPGAAAISGRVTTTTGTPLAGVTVQVLQGGTAVAAATTGADGTYSISGLAVGRYSVAASAAGYTFGPRVRRNVSLPPAKKNVSFVGSTGASGGLTNAGVKAVDSVNFLYYVTYTNSLNLPPDDAQLTIDPEGDNEDDAEMVQLDPTNTNYAAGVVFVYQTEEGLPAGNHTYRMEFEAGDDVVWTISGTGPTVQGAPGGGGDDDNQGDGNGGDGDDQGGDGGGDQQ